MIIAWMLYAVLVGALLTLAALAAEAALSLLRRPVRGVWATALALSLLIPSLSHFLPRTISAPTVIERLVTAAHQLAGAATDGGRPGTRARAGRSFPVQKFLLIGWAVASLGLLQLLLYSFGVLQGRRREWRRETIEGVPALIAADFGPAVVGWRRLQIVLPEWLLQMSQEARILVVRHETEHVRRLDPRLLLHAFCVVLTMPWNPTLWFQFRRLRRAIELDCDARVLAYGTDPGRYGEVLLEAGGFCRSGGLPALATFAERARDLEARIRALTRPQPARRGGPLLAAMCGAALLTIAACLMPDPLTPVRGGDIAIAFPPAGAVPVEVSWVAGQLKGHPPTRMVILFRSPVGDLLGMEDEAAKIPRYNSILAGHIHSIEVFRGSALATPGIQEVVVITLKPGVRISSAPAFGSYLQAITRGTVVTTMPSFRLVPGKKWTP